MSYTAVVTIITISGNKKAFGNYKGLWKII